MEIEKKKMTDHSPEFHPWRDRQKIAIEDGELEERGRKEKKRWDFDGSFAGVSSFERSPEYRHRRRRDRRKRKKKKKRSSFD